MAVTYIEGTGVEEGVEEEYKEEGLVEGIFPETVAARNFYKLARRYYSRNFGTFPKAEIDMLMFEFAHEAMSDKSTLEMAMQLGITPNRVEGYLEKMDLREKELGDADWWTIVKDVLTKSKAHYEHGKIYYVLTSRFLKHRLSEALDRGGYFHDYSFHSRALVVPSSAFLSVVLDIYFREKGAPDKELAFKEFEKAFRGDFKLDTSTWEKVKDEVQSIHNSIKEEEKYRAACRNAGSKLSTISGVIGVFGGFVGQSFGQ